MSLSRATTDGGAEFAGPENDGPKKIKDWKMQDLENDGPNCSSSSGKRYVNYGENSFTGALSSKFTGQKNVFCLLQSNVEYHIQAWSSDVRQDIY